MNRHVESLNRRMGEALGLLANQSRFQWRWAPDLFFYSREHAGESWSPHCWADRIGKVWVLTMLRPPTGTMSGCEVPITEADWWRAFRGTRPFPGKLTPYVFSETSLLPGLEPSDENTAFYIASLREQMEKSLRQLTEESYAECEADQLANKKEFFDMAADWFPAFWSTDGGAHTPGTRGGHVSFT